jgi:DNA replication protein DnaC
MGRRRAEDREADGLRRRVLDHFEALRIPIRDDLLDSALHEAEQQHLPHLAFLDRVLADQAAARRERTTERRIREAHFAERKALEAFDWDFNAKTIRRSEIEQLATCDFVRRRENCVVVGQSGIGKSHIMQAIGARACALGYTVRYTTSAALILDLHAALADRSLPVQIRRYSKPHLLIIDEFGFDKLERQECSNAVNLLYKVVTGRTGKSTALVTNVDFEDWAEYLGDPPLAMAFLDRVVDGAIVFKLKGKSYRANRTRHSEASA